MSQFVKAPRRKVRNDLAVAHVLPAPSAQPFNRAILTNPQLLLVTVLLAAVSYGWSFISDGFYQGEEGAQYINMLNFWKDWKVILGNWPKTGWKLVYALPALLGQQAVILLNCILSAFTAFFVYKVCVLKKVKLPAAGILMLFVQLLWFQLSHRTYCEILGAFLLIVSVYSYYTNRLILSALLISYLPVIRQELYPLALAFGIFLLSKKKIAPALLLATFPLLYNMAGYMATGDILYLLNNTKQMAEGMQSAYPRQGFDHYLRVAPAIFGSIPLACLIAYIALSCFKKLRADYLLLSVIVIVLLTHCILNWQSVVIGASTGGSWRYVLIVSPVVAVLAAIGFDSIIALPKKNKILFIMIPYLLLVMKYASFTHNWILYDTDSRDHTVSLFTLLIILLMMSPLPPVKAFYTLLLLSVAYMFVMVRPIKLAGENIAMREVYEWSKEHEIENEKYIVCSLPLFNFYYDRRNDQFPKGKSDVSIKDLQEAPVGSYIFWDSHYATKYGKVADTMLTTDKYQVIKTWVDPDRTIGIVLLEKIK